MQNVSDSEHVSEKILRDNKRVVIKETENNDWQYFKFTWTQEARSDFYKP